MSNGNGTILGRWVRRALYGAVIVLAALYVIERFVLPPILHRQIVGKLAELGYGDARVVVDHVSLTSAALRDLHSPAGLDAKVIHVTYTPATLLKGRVSDILVEGLFVKAAAFERPMAGASTTIPFSRLIIGASSIELPTWPAPTTANVRMEAAEDPAERKLKVSADISVKGARLQARAESDLSLQDIQAKARLDASLALVGGAPAGTQGDVWVEVGGTLRREAEGGRYAWKVDRCHLAAEGVQGHVKGLAVRDLNAKCDLMAEGVGESMTVRLLPEAEVGAGEVAMTGKIPAFALSLKPRPASLKVEGANWTLATAGAAIEVGDVAIDFPEGRLARRGERVFGRIASELELAQLGRSQLLLKIFPSLAKVELGGRARLEFAHASEPTGAVSATTSAMDRSGPDQPSLAVKVFDGTVSSQEYQLKANGIEAEVTFVDPANPRTLPEQKLKMQYGQMGKWEVRDALFQFMLKDLRTLEVQKTELGWLGGRIWADPYGVDFSSPAIRTRVYGRELDLGKLVWIFSSEKAWAEGKIAMELPMTFLWPRMRFGDGYVEADPGGVLHLNYASDELDRYLVAADPRFATDKTYSLIRERMVSALKNFSFSRLRIATARKDGHLDTMMTIQGKGNFPGGQEINLTFTVDDLDWLISRYLALPKQQ